FLHQPYALEFRQRVLDLEIELDARGSLQLLLDEIVELLGRPAFAWGAAPQVKISQERFPAVLLLALVQQPMQATDVVVEVLVVAALGDAVRVLLAGGPVGGVLLVAIAEDDAQWAIEGERIALHKVDAERAEIGRQLPAGEGDGAE